MLRTGALVKTLRRISAAVALVPAALQVIPVASIGSVPRSVVVIDAQDPHTVSSVVQSRRCTTSPRCDNGKDGIDIAELLTGTLPALPMLATVLTDTDCAPDRYGISHCLNALRLRNGDRLVVRHNHNMTAYPCLTPGDTVRVTRASQTR